MNRLKNRLLVGNIVAMLVLASAFFAGQGLAAPASAPLATVPAGSKFVYEGRLGSQTGAFDFKFRLFDAATGGNLVSTTVVAISNVTVVSGEYRVGLDFGITPFTKGDGRFLEVQFRTHTTNAGAVFTTQTLRQVVFPVAYALNSLTSLNMFGNSGTTPGTNFLGTTDSQSLVMKTNNVERMRVNTSGNVGVGTSAPIARLEALASPGAIGLLGTSSARGVVGRLGNTSCAGTYGVGGCGGSSGDGVLGRSNARGVIGALGDSSCAGTYGVGGCAGNTGQVGVHGASDTGRAVEGFSGNGIGVIGDSSTRGVVGTLNQTSCAGIYAVGGCNASDGPGVYGFSNSDKGVWGNSGAGGNARGVVGTVGATSCAGSYGVGGCTGDTGAYGVFGPAIMVLVLSAAPTLAMSLSA